MSLSKEQLNLMHGYWRAANYFSVAQIYLLDNPLLREKLTREHIKPRLLGHFGTVPGLNFIYVHLNRIICNRDSNVIYITGPGHGGPGLVANAYLEGTYTEVYPDIEQNVEGLKRLFKQFSFPGGIPSHVAPETPGSIHEGGELGYALSHAFGAVFDHPELVVACVVGDGEAETGPLATSWHSNKFLNPERDGAVLPILHLNGYKIAGPTVLARIPYSELELMFRGMGWKPILVETDGSDNEAAHQAMAKALDECFDEIAKIQQEARANGFSKRPIWPMIVLRSPKGWTGPEVVDKKKSAGTFRSHQVPMKDMNKEHVKQLQDWLESYEINELLDENGKLKQEYANLAPKGTKRMSANPLTNPIVRPLRMPDFRTYAITVSAPGATSAEATRTQGLLIRDVMRKNPTSFRVFSPDETASNRWQACFEVTKRCSVAEVSAEDEDVAADGRVMEMLSEHQMQGWLEGYLLTGRHGFFSCYEAFVHIIDSMCNQHAKWLKVSREISWRNPISSLNILLTSHVWQQDHNGFSHQDPGFVDLLANKKGSAIRVYFPPDANTLLSMTDHVMRSTDKINVLVAGKAPALQWFSMDDAIKHCTSGIGILKFASTDENRTPDVVLACVGDVPTLEVVACSKILQELFPDLAIRVINVVDIFKLSPREEHPHGLSDKEFDTLFTKDKPVIMSYHGYPWLIHRLAYRRTNHKNMHVRGYKEEGTTTTPFDMCVLNETDRFHLAQDVIDRVPSLQHKAAYAKQHLRDKLIDHRNYVCEKGIDMPEILDFKWK